jgi:adenosylmethionine-8-amino-7-oxononanoate aminotransferase
MYEGAQNIAAVLIETVTGTNGLIVPPDGYLPGLRALCDKHNILLIADEIMAGFGRTGEWFAVNHWHVTPDIMTMAKGLTSSYAPLGAVAMREDIGAHFDNKVFYGGLTYNSHPLSLATAIATINVYKEDKLIDNARRMGKVMAGMLDDLKAEHPCTLDRPVRHCRTGTESKDQRAARAVQRHQPRDAETCRLLPRERTVHFRALEYLLRQPAADHQRGAVEGSVRYYQSRSGDHRSGGERMNGSPGFGGKRDADKRG